MVLATALIMGRFASHRFRIAVSDTSRKAEAIYAPEIANLATPAPGGRISASPRDPQRVVYPYSLIPGGIHGSEELWAISARDGVVAANFAGFNFQRATLVRLKAPKLVYLAYRLHDRVFWTKKKVRLVVGETLITDGKITARTRCANPISDSKKGPYSPEEPEAYKFHNPVGQDGPTAAQLTFPSQFDTALLSPEMPLLPSPASPPVVVPPVPPVTAGGKGWFIPPLVPPIPGGSSSPTPPVLPLAVTPEPSTILLISTGVAGLYVRYRRKSKGQ